MISLKLNSVWNPFSSSMVMRKGRSWKLIKQGRIKDILRMMILWLNSLQLGIPKWGIHALAPDLQGGNVAGEMTPPTREREQA
jgi:hypothetical protein